MTALIITLALFFAADAHTGTPCNSDRECAQSNQCRVGSCEVGSEGMCIVSNRPDGTVCGDSPSGFLICKHGSCR